MKESSRISLLRAVIPATLTPALVKKHKIPSYSNIGWDFKMGFLEFECELDQRTAPAKAWVAETSLTAPAAPRSLASLV